MATAGRADVSVSPAWWGFSPAIDLQTYCLQSTIENLTISDNIQEFNILLVGSGDCRHVLKTICQAHRWPQKKFNFYMIETELGLLARHMLFLTLALEKPEKMGLQEKSEIFLELFGNSMVRSQTAAYLQEKCNLFIRCVTDPDFQQSVMPYLNMTCIKYKDRDELEQIFKYWRAPDPNLFPIVRYWDVKNRQYLGRRYDSRRGAYDWDLSMKLHDRGAALIHCREYYRWREKGMAFVLREGNYDMPNKTLASHMVITHNSGSVSARGYWGDIITSPFIAFGIETEEKSLLRTANGVHEKSAQEVSLFNISAMFSELVTGQKLTPKAMEAAAGKYPGYHTECSDDGEGTEGTNGVATGENTTLTSSNSEFITLHNVEIHFLPFSWINDIHRRSKFFNFFNMIYFSCSTVHLLEADFKQIAARKAILLLELTKFMVELNIEKIKKYINVVTKVASDAGFNPVHVVDWKMNNIAAFERIDDVETLRYEQ